MAPTCGQPTTIPASDSSPPAVGIHYAIDGTGQILPFPSSGSLTVDFGQTFCIYPWAEDDQGVRLLSMGGESNKTCVQGNLGQNTHGLLGDGDSQSGQPGDTAYTGLYLGSCYDTNQLGRCSPGWSITDLSFFFQASAQNFHGGTSLSATAFVDVRLPSQIPPPDDPPPPGDDPVCPSGQVCCEDLPDGSCNICRPSWAECP